MNQTNEMLSLIYLINTGVLNNWTAAYFTKQAILWYSVGYHSLIILRTKEESQKKEEKNKLEQIQRISNQTWWNNIWYEFFSQLVSRLKLINKGKEGAKYLYPNSLMLLIHHRWCYYVILTSLTDLMVKTSTVSSPFCLLESLF